MSEMVEVTDGNGAVLRLPENLYVRDCAGCRCLIVSYYHLIDNAYRRGCKRMGGVKRSAAGHNMPYCQGCWVEIGGKRGKARCNSKQQ